MEGTGLVDGAVSPEKPDKARKPGPRQVSIKVSMVSRIAKRAKKAKQEDDPHGLLTHGPHWTHKRNDPHGLLAYRLETAHKQGKSPDTLTLKGTQPTHVRVDPNRVTQSKPEARRSKPA